MHSCKEVVFLIVKHIVTHGNTWCHEFCYSSLHHLVHLTQSLLAFQLSTFLLWIFQLIADSHSLTSTNKFWQKSVESMMRKTSHLCGCRFSTIISFGKSDTKYSRSLYCIITISFIKITTTKQHQSIRMLCL